MTIDEARHWLEIELKKWEDECKSKHPIKEALDVAIEALKQEPRWIPIDEQLPEEKGQYLVTYYPCFWNTVKYDIYVGLDSFRGKTTWAKNANQKVIAWQPLPKPYKTQESEKN